MPPPPQPVVVVETDPPAPLTPADNGGWGNPLGESTCDAPGEPGAGGWGTAATGGGTGGWGAAAGLPQAVPPPPQPVVVAPANPPAQPRGTWGPPADVPPVWGGNPTYRTQAAAVSYGELDELLVLTGKARWNDEIAHASAPPRCTEAYLSLSCTGGRRLLRHRTIDVHDMDGVADVMGNTVHMCKIQTVPVRGI
jgi:hypothetical protein